MKMLDHLVTEKLKNYKDHINEAINSEPKFDTSSFNLSSGTSDPLPVVTVSLRVGRKHIATTVAGLTCLWYIGATKSMIKILHTNHYERKMRSNKVDYGTFDGVYCTTRDVKVPFCMPEFSRSKIINHLFHIDNDKGKSGISCYMIIGRDLMVQLGLTADFNHQVLQWYGDTVHIKEPSGFLGQSNLTKREMREVVMQTTEPASAREAIERIVKIFDSTYAKSDLKHVVDSAIQLNSE